MLLALLGCAHPVPAVAPAPVPAASAPADPAAVGWCLRALVARQAGDAAEVARASRWVGLLDPGPDAAACAALATTPPTRATVLPAPIGPEE